MDPYEDIKTATVEPPAWTKHWQSTSLQDSGRRDDNDDKKGETDDDLLPVTNFGSAFESSKYEPSAELFYPSVTMDKPKKNKRKRKKSKKRKKQSYLDQPSVVTMSPPLDSGFGVVGAGIGVSSYGGGGGGGDLGGTGGLSTGWGPEPTISTDR